MENVFIGLGGNIGDSKSLLQQAISEVDAIAATRVIAKSSLYRSAPIGKLDQPDFINAVVQLRTDLDPTTLLGELHRIERRHGRVRGEKNGPRIIDLDLLLYDALVLETAVLTLPHPRMHERAFVLQPLCEVAPGCIIPGRGPAIRLLSTLPNQGVCKLEPT